MNEDFGDIGAIVSAAARAVPPAPQDLLGVRRKAVTRKRRRLYGGSLGIALVTAAAIVVPVALPHPPPAPGAEIASPAPVSPSVKPRPVTMEQRLFVSGGGYLSGPNLTDASVVSKPEDAPPDTIGVLGQEFEVLADGTARAMPEVKGTTFVETMVPTADGGWVVLGFKDLRPGERREDGDCVADVEKPLIVISPKGEQTVLRNVHKRCHPPELAGVHNGRALLIRDDLLIAHDLRSGKENVLHDLGPVGSTRATGVDGKFFVSITHADLNGCHDFAVTTVDLETGVSGQRNVAMRLCSRWPSHVRVSPDATRIAFAHAPLSRDVYRSVTVLDLASGAIVANHDFKLPPGQDKDVMIGGLAWIDNASMRVVYALPPDAGVHYYRDIMQTIDISVR